MKQSNLMKRSNLKNLKKSLRIIIIIALILTINLNITEAKTEGLVKIQIIHEKQTNQHSNLLTGAVTGLGIPLIDKNNTKDEQTIKKDLEINKKIDQIIKKIKKIFFRIILKN